MDCRPRRERRCGPTARRRHRRRGGPGLRSRAYTPDTRGSVPQPSARRGWHLMATLVVARLTIREAARRRLLLALVVLTLVVIALTAWGFQHLTALTGADGRPLPAAETRLGTSQVLILVEFMFSGVLALSAVVVAAPSISGDVESGVSLAMLARPLARYQVVLGKWLGLAALILVYTVASSVLDTV